MLWWLRTDMHRTRRTWQGWLGDYIWRHQMIIVMTPSIRWLLTQDKIPLILRYWVKLRICLILFLSLPTFLLGSRSKTIRLRTRGAVLFCFVTITTWFFGLVIVRRRMLTRAFRIRRIVCALFIWWWVSWRIPLVRTVSIATFAMLDLGTVSRFWMGQTLSTNTLYKEIVKNV